MNLRNWKQLSSMETVMYLYTQMMKYFFLLFAQNQLPNYLLKNRPLNYLNSNNFKCDKKKEKKRLNSLGQRKKKKTNGTDWNWTIKYCKLRFPFIELKWKRMHVMSKQLKIEITFKIDSNDESH